MKELIRKSILLGLGAASLTRNKVEKVVKQIAKKGGINQKDTKQLVIKVVAQANKERMRIQALAQKEASRLAKKVSVVSRAEAHKMKKKVKALEKKLHAEGKRSAKKFLNRVVR